MIKTKKEKGTTSEAGTIEKKKFEQKDFSGALFTNKKKESEKHPDMNGSVIIEGVEYWISAWEKQSKAGEGYYSLAFTPKDKV